VIGTYPTEDSAMEHAQKHAWNTYQKPLEEWKVGTDGQTCTIPGTPPIVYEVKPA
jgi:hypothetical protein